MKTHNLAYLFTLLTLTALLACSCETRTRDTSADAGKKQSGKSAKSSKPPAQVQPGRNKFVEAEPGFEIAVFDSPLDAAPEAEITVARIDTSQFNMKLLSAAELEIDTMTAGEWGEEFGLVAAINAGMFGKDGLTSVGYMKNYDYVNNGRVASRHRSALAFHALNNRVPPIQIIDLECQDFDMVKNQYQTIIQSIRMIDCKGENVWRASEDINSMAAIGTDRAGRALLLFVREPISVFDFINALKALPIDIDRAMYLEGGPQATLFVSAGDIHFEKVGASDLFENKSAWPIPNVIAFERRR